jgi:hypothetical protein
LQKVASLAGGTRRRVAVALCGAIAAIGFGQAQTTPAVGVYSFEDGASTAPVQVWYAPGSVANVAGGHAGVRSVAASGNVLLSFQPATAEHRVVYWLRTNSRCHIAGVIQYYGSSWQSLGQADFELAADATWREQLHLLGKPAGTTYVLVGMWIPSGVTAWFDDVVAAANNPPGAIEGFETGSPGPWSVWYPPAAVQNTNVIRLSGSRSVGLSGSLKLVVAPFVTSIKFSHRRASGTAPITGVRQYFDRNWTQLGETTLPPITSTTTWQQATIAIDAPANTMYVLVGVWPNGSGAGATVYVDDYSTAPAVQPARRPFSPTSPWNTTLTDIPHTFETRPELQSMHWWVALESYSFQVVNSSPSDPMVAVGVPASWGRPAATINVRIPPGITGASGTDGSLQVNDPAGTSHSFWQFQRTSVSTATAQAYGSTPLDGDGFTDPVTGLNAGIRAAMASPMAGLLTGPEIAAGEIDHALAVSLPVSMLARGWVPPARAEDSTSSWAYTGSAIRMGSRLGIPETATMPAGLSSLGQKVWRAIKKYGLLVVDTGSTPALYADPGSMTGAQVDPLRVYWCGGCGNANDLDRIALQLQLVVPN